uniref:Uncharacterized protein n=1 Tax=uncultured bacterium A1Q1_fos_2004 TaxID=1256557 RepID=L7W1E7_9BACT|nr:hypothetical protein [uncultured bacterium A1Q1_fos_2004]
MSTVFEVLPILCSFSLFLSILHLWQCRRDLTKLSREIERHEQGREIKRRVLGELARKAVQP